MALYVIADLHLSTLEKTDKSMEVFGHRWDGYITRLNNNWRHLVTDADTVVIPGDISWALTLEEAESDLKFIDSLPGRKILLKGNHDFWWMTMAKHARFFEEKGIGSVSFLYNNALECEDFILAGTRGWYQDEDARTAPENADFDKLINRESLRLKASLDDARRLKGESDREIIVFMHFPPVWSGKAVDEFITLLKDYGVRRVYFGHIHGNYTVSPSFVYNGIEMNLISADYLGFVPMIIK